MKRILFLLVFISVAPGCLIIPLSSDHGEEIDKVQSQIKMGFTTREEVISILGPPNVTRDRFILYRQKEYSGGAFLGILLPSPAAAAAASGVAGQVFMDLYFEFDNYGVLVDFRTDKYDRYLRSVKDDEDTSKTEEACDPGIESCT